MKCCETCKHWNWTYLNTVKRKCNNPLSPRGGEFTLWIGDCPAWELGTTGREAKLEAQRAQEFINDNR